jgi:hypothetical protein
MIRFTLRDLLWLVVVAALCAAWARDAMVDYTPAPANPIPDAAPLPRQLDASVAL